jgi:hypothetical protein
MTRGEQAQVNRYGKDVLDDCPKWTKENFAALDKDNDADEEDDMPTTQSRALDYSREVLDKAILDLADDVQLREDLLDIPQQVQHLDKGLSDQSHAMARLRGENAILRAANDALEQRIAALERRQSQARGEMRSLKKGLQEQWLEEHEQPRSRLQKAIGLWQRFRQYPHITTGLASRTRAQVEVACAAD